MNQESRKAGKELTGFGRSGEGAKKNFPRRPITRASILSAEITKNHWLFSCLPAFLIQSYLLGMSDSPMIRGNA
jgi:hypothetical protein